ncbi:hypothetical protein B0J12DRAFT_571706 [Macrophomina phaseolina]|uniref:Glycosyl transferase family 25 n=1 Tax=Macrophomina phaseolina TaxID=35725 RepID=A0ABQ8GEN6_9PEZI|nr:hypothetical protein B0J12DRAFT_571706 [Macrophomina phaseolina]
MPACWPRSRNKVLAAICLAVLVPYVLLSLSGTSSPLPLTLRGSDLLDDVFNQTLGFQKIFVINLPSRDDLRDSMSLAAALTGLDIEYVDGVTEAEEKTLPPGSKETNLAKGSLYAWRAHMNVVRMIVEQNLTSALVLEGDVDWDIRIKQQMRDFALASQLLVQPLAGTKDRFIDPTYPEPLPDQRPPTTSAYGDIDRWDLLWVGHCGTRFPKLSDGNAPLGRALLNNDASVPEQQHLDVENGGWDLLREYPAHTRIVHRARVSTCTFGYGISRPGARRLLYELGIRKMTGTNDMMFRSVCDGVDGRPLFTCLTVQPQLFNHHRPAGDTAALSDINDLSGQRNEQGYTKNIRWSTKLNFEKLLSAQTDYIDLFPDGEPERKVGPW